jgi:hypothetical protein
MIILYIFEWGRMMKSLNVKCKVIDCGNGMFGIAVENVCVSEKEYRYLTCDKEAISSLAVKINNCDVSPLHIEDIIDDFLE